LNGIDFRKRENAAEKSGIDAWVNYADKSFCGCVTGQSAMLTKIFARVRDHSGQ
jgi:hypothetical protein